MSSFRKSPVALVGLLVLTVTLAALLAPAVAAQKERAPRKFYLTKTQHNGSQALTACAAGYHMASLWEIFDTSNFKYDTQLGVTTADSGSGPPNGINFGIDGGITVGWVRTGGRAEVLLTTGLPPNCNAWTSANEADAGTTVNLGTFWALPGEGDRVLRVIDPWVSNMSPCNAARGVWCVQD